jgi:hypothetical protein
LSDPRTRDGRQTLFGRFGSLLRLKYPPLANEEVDGTRNRPSPNISTSIHRPIKMGPPVYLPQKIPESLLKFFSLLLPVTACSCPTARLPSKDPAIVRRRSRVSLPRLHLDHLLRGWPDCRYAVHRRRLDLPGCALGRAALTASTMSSSLSSNSRAAPRAHAEIPDRAAIGRLRASLP